MFVNNYSYATGAKRLPSPETNGAPKLKKGRTDADDGGGDWSTGVLAKPASHDLPSSQSPQVSGGAGGRMLNADGVLAKGDLGVGHSSAGLPITFTDSREDARFNLFGPSYSNSLGSLYNANFFNSAGSLGPYNGISYSDSNGHSNVGASSGGGTGSAYFGQSGGPPAQTQPQGSLMMVMANAASATSNANGDEPAEGSTKMHAFPMPGPHSEPTGSVTAPAHMSSQVGTGSTTLTTSIAVDPNRRADQSWVDLTPFLNMPQSEAAKKLNVPSSTLSKRWKEAVISRKWPWRSVNKIDREIMSILRNISNGRVPESIEARLSTLALKRQECLSPVYIRI